MVPGSTMPLCALPSVAQSAITGRMADSMFLPMRRTALYMLDANSRAEIVVQRADRLAD